MMKWTKEAVQVADYDAFVRLCRCRTFEDSIEENYMPYP